MVKALLHAMIGFVNKDRCKCLTLNRTVGYR